MTKDNAKRRGISWFKTSNSTQQQSENNLDLKIDTIEMSENEKVHNMNNSEELEAQSNNQIFSKDNQDKVVIDLIVSLENLIKDRQLIIYKKKSLEDQLSLANDTISRMKKDLIKKEQLLQEKNKEIRELENSLTNKQMSYEQLLEDYKEFQDNSNMEYDRLSTQLEAEINKYNKLNEESMDTQYKNMLRINELEETIRNLEIENKQYLLQYEKILAEKSELMKVINDFTEKMSFSFSPKVAPADISDSK